MIDAKILGNSIANRNTTPLSTSLTQFDSLAISNILTSVLAMILPQGSTVLKSKSASHSQTGVGRRTNLVKDKRNWNECNGQESQKRASPRDTKSIIHC